jgi:hypothetical protein
VELIDVLNKKMLLEEKYKKINNSVKCMLFGPIKKVELKVK